MTTRGLTVQEILVVIVIVAVLVLISLPQLTQYTSKRPNDLDAALEELPWGNIAYDIPEEIPIGDSKVAVLKLSPTKTIEELTKALGEDSRVQTATVQISQRMKASLKSADSDFKIDLIGEEIQAVSFNQDTEWTWDMTALNPGNSVVTLSLSILIKIEGNDTFRTIESHRAEIEVTATTQQKIESFWAKNWQWLSTTVLIPILFALWKFIKWLASKRKEKEDEENKREIGFDTGDDPQE